MHLAPIRSKTHYLLSFFKNFTLSITLGGIAAILIAIIWMGTTFLVNFELQTTIETNTRVNSNLTKSFEEHIRHDLQATNDILLLLKNEYEAIGQITPETLEHLRKITFLPMMQLFIINEQGEIMASLNPVSPRNFQSADFFSTHITEDTHKIYIGKPLSEEGGFNASHRLNKQDGTFGGVVVATLASEYFSDLYRRMDLGKDETIMLIGRDGFVRAAIRAGLPMEVGIDVSTCPLFDYLPKSNMGSYFATAPGDNITRLINYQAMPDYPLVLLVGVSENEALKNYYQCQNNYYHVALLLSLFIALTFFLINKMTKHIQLEREIKLLNQNLEKRVKRRTTELEQSNEKLQLEISERMTIQNKLEQEMLKCKKLQNNMDRLLNMSFDCFCIIHFDFTFHCLNPAFLQTLGYEEEILLSKNILTLIHPDELGRFEKNLREMIYSGSGIKISQNRYLCTDGSYKWFEWSAAVVMDESLIYIIARDITHQKEIDSEIARLDRLNMIGQIAASIGHEVRNPMTTVQGFLQFLGRKNEFGKYQENFTIMIQELKRANSIITEFLSLAKNKKIDLVEMNLNPIIEALFPLLQARGILENKEIVLDLHDIDNLKIDEKEIRQLILNLVQNSFDAMDAGGKIQIGTCQNENAVVLTIKDNGNGIPKHIYDKLGTPFMTTKDNGTGLGLAVCYSIAARHHADIDVDTSSSGTTFKITFSCEPAD